MAAYYYLISSLPSLKADAPMPFTYQQFLDQCKSSVSQSVYNTLKDMTQLSSEGPLLKQWGSFNQKFVDELNYQRKLKLGKPVDRDHQVDAEIAKATENVLNAKNPLESEQIMLQYQFDLLDSLVSMHYFDEYVLYGYALKLILLTRRNVFKTEEGSAEFKRLFENVQAQILSI